jgi:hypothetical protein
MDFRELDLRVADLEQENKRLRAALKAIANPIQHMQEEAVREGMKLDGHMATAMADSPAYLSGLAKKALEQ